MMKRHDEHDDAEDGEDQGVEDVAEMEFRVMRYLPPNMCGR